MSMEAKHSHIYHPHAREHTVLKKSMALKKKKKKKKKRKENQEREKYEHMADC